MLVVLSLLCFFIALYLFIDCRLHGSIRCVRAKRILCPLVSVNKSAFLNYGNVLWLWLSRLKWNRICPKGKRDERIIWHQQLPFNGGLLFPKHCAGTFVCISPELPKSLLTRPALACKVIPFTFPQDLRQGDPLPNTRLGSKWMWKLCFLWVYLTIRMQL